MSRKFESGANGREETTFEILRRGDRLHVVGWWTKACGELKGNC